MAVILSLLTAVPCPAFAGRGGSEPAAPMPPSQTADVTLLADGVFFDELEDAVNHARKDILICAYQFTAGERGARWTERILNALADAAKSGVKVTVILDQDRRDRQLTGRNRRTARLLQRAGITVIYDNPRVTTHVKAAVIDERWTFLGSHNLSEGGLRYNHELSLLVDSPKFARSVVDYLEDVVIGSRKRSR